MMQIQSEFAEIYRKYFDAMYRFARRKGLPHDLCEDVANETFLRLLQQADKLTFEDEAPLRMWLYQTSLNVIKEFYRKQRRTENIEESETIVEKRNAVVERVEQMQYLHYIEKFESLLNSQQIILFHLHFMQQKTVDEIVELLDMNKNTVRSHIHRIREKIRTYLTEHDIS